MSAPLWCFDRFRLDPTNARLWCGHEAITLPPKAFDVLHYLVRHPERLVSKDELLDAIWPETSVSDAVVRVAIGALRKALGDTPPRLIATVPRRDYRLLAPVTRAEATAPSTLLSAPPPLLLEREAILQRLEDAWMQARQGHRQMVWVTGEAGMGKTAVVEAFAARVAADPEVLLALGQCVLSSRGSGLGCQNYKYFQIKKIYDFTSTP